MNQELIKEADKYSNEEWMDEQSDLWMEKINPDKKDAFISGAESNYVKNEIIRGKIEVLDKYIWDERLSAHDKVFTEIRSAMIQEIQFLKQQLSDEKKA